MDFIKKLKPFDYIVIVIIALCLIVGFLTYSGKRATSSKNIEKTSNIEFSVYLRGVATTSSEPLIKADDETFITIRNVPYTKLKVTKVEAARKKEMVATDSVKQKFILVDDMTMPYTYDYIVTLQDKAKITKDTGDIVVGGNKVKIGLPITLEGAKYKLNGVISDVTVSD